MNKQNCKNCKREFSKDKNALQYFCGKCVRANDGTDCEDYYERKASHKLREDDPLFYKKALMGLFANAKENGVNIRLKGNYLIFDDERNGVVTTSCSVEIITE